MEGGAQIGNSAPDQQAQTSNLDPAAASSYQGIQRLKEEEGKEIVQQREETLQSHTSFEKSTTPLRPPAHGKDGSPEPKQCALSSLRCFRPVQGLHEEKEVCLLT